MNPKTIKLFYFIENAFPNATGLRYTENDQHYHILCRDGMFVVPEGGWLKEGRTYVAVITQSKPLSTAVFTPKYYPIISCISENAMREYNHQEIEGKVMELNANETNSQRLVKC